MSVRSQLLTMFSYALKTVEGDRLVSTWLSSHTIKTENIWVISIGKAAQSMLLGVCNQKNIDIRGILLISKYGHLFPEQLSACPELLLLEAGHPYPDKNSLLAGETLLRFIEKIPDGDTVLFLVSGGASSLVEVVADGVTAEDLTELNRWLLAQGWPIDKMNRLRKSVSLIKGGRLARYLPGREVIQLLISDVPDNRLDVIGSGLLVADEDKHHEEQNLPGWLVRMQDNIPTGPVADDPCMLNIKTFLIGDNRAMRDAIELHAIEHGQTVHSNMPMSGDITSIAETIAKTLLDGKPGCYIWGGEGVIVLPENPGLGGRCQALALQIALYIQGRADIMVLAAGSDGTDGPGDAAGAIIDGGTIQRGVDAGLDADSAIDTADSGIFLAASGDLLDTGPTGTNVMDLVIAIKH